jgi:hypothetical protein
MKNVIIFTLLLATLACNKKSDSDLKQSRKNNFFEIKDLLIGTSVDPEACICAYSHLGSNGVRSYDFRAYFKSHPDSPYNYSVGALTCNSKTVPMIASENNSYVLQDNDGANSSFKNWLNNSLNISFTGMSSYAGGNITIQKHSEFTQFSLSNVSGNNNSFNKNGNLPVSWNADPNNTDSVFIVVTYDYEVTKDFFNSTATPTPVINQIKVPDNGTCTLPASFFSSFPNNSFNRIEIYRGNYENFDVGTTGNPRTVGVLGYSKAVLKLHIL